MAAGKASHYILDDSTAAVVDPGREQRYVESVVPESLVVRRELLARLEFAPGGWWDIVEALPAAVVASGERLYAADRFNFARSAAVGAARHNLRVDVYGAGAHHIEV